MKITKTIAKVFTIMLFMLLCLNPTATIAQSKINTSVMKDCCMMKDGKMMVFKDGKMTRMKKSMTMENGTICKRNGVCIMKDGTRVKMKEGNCMDNSGKMDNCSTDVKTVDIKTKKVKHPVAYTCSMHPEVKSDEPGKCPKCGMALVVKK